MNKPLSFSAYKRLTSCAQYYKYYDVDKDRPTGLSSALIVGNIVDESVMATLKGELRVKPDLTRYIDETVEFFNDDLDLDLIDTDEIAKIATKVGWKGDTISEALKDFLKDQATLSAKQRKVLNIAVWQSLGVKIEAMLDSFEKWILPQIKQVHDIQTHLDDNVTHGYLDFTATMNDGRRVLFDLKTSKMPYAKDAVLKSPQLSLYAAMHNYEYAGFIVLVKNLNKNKVKTCPTCNYTTSGGNRTKCPDDGSKLEIVMEPTSFSQLLIDKVPDHNKALTLQAMNDSIALIDNGVFPRNLNNCFNMYGKNCPYVNKCWNKGE